MTVYVGHDIHTRNTFVVAKLDNEETVLSKRIPNTRESFEKVFHEVREIDPHIIAGMESSINSSWVADVLEDLHVDFEIANAFKLKHILSEEIKNDKVDANGIATLLMSPSLFPKSYHVPRDIRYRRDMLRYRAGLKNLENYFKTVIWGVLLRLQRTPPMKNLFTCKGKEWLENLELPGHYNLIIRDHLALLSIVRERITRLDKLVKPWCDEYPVVKLLQTIPGLGWFGALLFYLEIHDIKRFASPKKLCSFAGVVPVDKSSGYQHHQGGLKKQCNHWLRWMAVQAATSQAMRNSPIGVIYRRIKKRRNHASAKVAAARHIVWSVFWVWTRNEPFKWDKPRPDIKGTKTKTYVLRPVKNNSLVGISSRDMVH